MAKEEFTVRIGKKGEVFVETGNLPPQRVKDLIRYLEETMGPARIVDAEGGAAGREEITIEQTETEEEETREKPRLKLRRGD